MVTYRRVLKIGYGMGKHYPQYAALHLNSSYLRLNYGLSSGWGTSVVLLPSFWQHGLHHFAGPIKCTYKADGYDLIISISGKLSGLQAIGEIRLSPPNTNAIHAHVSMTITGNVTLDDRPAEAFKHIMLSSMHISEQQWDAQYAVIEEQTLDIPKSGWLATPPTSARTFGLTGGTSAWKSNAPTIEITFAEPHTITGWVTASADPNDDNIGLWATSDKPITSWDYDIVARQAE